MSASEQADDQPPAESAEQVTELFDSLDGTKVIETEEFKRFLDHVPIAIIISKFIQGHQLTCYANPAFESLMGPTLAENARRDWSIFAEFKGEDENVTLQSAVLDGREDFLGRFRLDTPKLLIIEAYAGLIENEDGTENYRIAALIDVTDRERASASTSSGRFAIRTCCSKRYSTGLETTCSWSLR